MPDITLRGITWDHIRGFGPLEASVAPYKEETGIVVQWEKRTLKDFGDASLEMLARRYDLIVMDHPHVGVASDFQCIVPLDEILDRETIRDASRYSAGPSFTSYLYHSHLWALPIDAACQVSSRREDLLPLSHLPQQWNDVFDLAERLTPKGLFIGAALCPTDCNCCFLTLCAQAGDPVEEGKFTSAVTAHKVLSLLQKLHAVCHPASATWNPVQLYDHMSCNDDVVYSPLGFGYTNYARDAYGKNKLRFGSIPGHSNALLGGAGIAVSAYGQAINKAAAYAAWLCSEEYQCTSYVFAGGQPAHRQAWTNTQCNEMTGNFFSDTLSTLEAAYVRPRNLRWPSFQEELGDIIHTGLVEKHSIEQMWEKITTVYRALVM